MPAPDFGAVEAPWWDDRPAIIVGTGPSLRGFDLSRLEGLGHVLAVKEAVEDLPFAAALFSMDLPWINRRSDWLRDLAIPRYLAVPDEQPFKHRAIAGAIFLNRCRREGFSEHPAMIHHGGNSGYGAVNLAFLKRAKTIVLFGFDYSGTEPNPHYCSERYSWYQPFHNARYWPRWAENYRSTVGQLARAGVSVLNASPESNVDAFPRTTIEAAMQHLDRLRPA